jgi:hypothetical protein
MFIEGIVFMILIIKYGWIYLSFPRKAVFMDFESVQFTLKAYYECFDLHHSSSCNLAVGQTSEDADALSKASLIVQPVAVLTHSLLSP